MEKIKFKFQTMGEANELAMILSNVCPEPQKAVFGLSELFINAVEHGNLGITYQEKSAMLRNQQFSSEIEKRFEQNKHKYVEVICHNEKDRIVISIKDEGEGFDWEKYLKHDIARDFDLHGRGIMMAEMISFSQIEYLGRGNEVNVTILKH